MTDGTIKEEAIEAVDDEKEDSEHSGSECGLLECDQCGEMFHEVQQLRVHYTMHRQRLGRPKCHPRVVVCTVCNKKFRKESQLTEHARVHTGEKPYACALCDKRFRLKVGYTAHYRIHTGERPYQCKECGKTFTMNSHLSVHMRAHSQDKPFKCDVCGKTFKRGNHLTVHRRQHTGERPYSCQVCSRNFSRQTDLKIHGRLHSGEKPYSCTHCNEKFHSSGYLHKHLKTHVVRGHDDCEMCNTLFQTSQEQLKAHLKADHRSEKKFDCDICHKKFMRSRSLIVHLRIHSGVKPWSCPTCDRPFHDKSYFNKHSRICKMGTRGPWKTKRVRARTEPDCEHDGIKVGCDEEEEVVSVCVKEEAVDDVEECDYSCVSIKEEICEVEVPETAI